LIARAANIVPISTFLNLFQRKKENKISWKYQLMMWWAGDFYLFFFFSKRNPLNVIKC